MRLHLWKATLSLGLASLSPYGLRHAGPRGTWGRGIVG